MFSCLCVDILVRKFKCGRKTPKEQAPHTDQVKAALKGSVQIDGIPPVEPAISTPPATSDRPTVPLQDQAATSQLPQLTYTEPSASNVAERVELKLHHVQPTPLMDIHTTSGEVSLPTNGRDPSNSTQATAAPDTLRSRAADLVVPALKTGLEVLQGLLSDFSMPGGSACNVIIQVIDKLDEMKSNSAALHSLQSHCNRINRVMDGFSKAKANSKLSLEATEALQHLNSELHRAVAPHLGNKSVWLRFLESGQDAERIKEDFDEVARLMTEFVSAVTIDSWLFATSEALANNIDKITRVAAAYDDANTTGRVEMCLAGTRDALRDDILHWATSSNERSIYLLVGHPGFGKSTIARTIAARADIDLNLGASFFFSRNEVDLRSPTKFFSTLAYQLCLHEPMFADAIGEALKSPGTKNALTKEPSVQCRYLISGPLAPFTWPNAQSPAPHLVLIVVDALDECEDPKDLIWNGLRQLVKDLPFVKVLLTSRSSDHLSVLIKDAEELCVKEPDITSSDPDIMSFLSDQLVDHVPPEFDELFDGWKASPDELRRLNNMSAGLFIVASTAVKYIRHDKLIANPSKRIHELVEKSEGTTNYLTAIDHTYETVLSKSLDLGKNQELKERYSVVIGAIVFLRKQLSLEDLARLLDATINEMKTMLRKLQAIITISKENGTPQFHQSFADYMNNEGRSKTLYVRDDAETNLTVHCLRILHLNIPSHNAYEAHDMVFDYAFDHVHHHLSRANPSAVLPRLSELAQGISDFWTNIAIYRKICLHPPEAYHVLEVVYFYSSSDPLNFAWPPLIPGEIISQVTLLGEPHDKQMDHMWPDLDQARKIEDINLHELADSDISMEEDLRFILTSPLHAQHWVTSRKERVWVKYVGILLICLNASPVWQEHWIVPTLEDRSRQKVDEFIGKVVMKWTPDSESVPKSRFSEEALAILRRKLLEGLQVDESGSSSSCQTDTSSERASDCVHSRNDLFADDDTSRERSTWRWPSYLLTPSSPSLEDIELEWNPNNDHEL